ncbi:amidohydrolase [Rhodococcus sp. ACT016]|uniref:amidohydrolase n=1 Tax=Rhodococcus sp. ACT016 TaxID=3134808 RepID=UPI003D2BE7A1
MTTTTGILDAVEGIQDTFITLRRDLHRHPELAYDEVRTAALVRSQLADMGIPIVAELATTGLVAAIQSGSGTRSIGLRADMDALAIDEQTNLAHASTVEGVMHACGHDGHVAMLLAAANHLATTRNFDGTVYLIFQPAEEGGGGAKVMVDQGLFDQFPMDEIYALHSWPALRTGTIAVSPGPVMASTNDFEITLHGPGGHAAFPHLSADLIGLAATIVTHLRSLTTSTLPPGTESTLAVTSVNGGTAINAFPTSVSIRGTLRAFSDQIVDTIERHMREPIDLMARAAGATATVTLNRIYPPTINSPKPARRAEEVATTLVGAERVVTQTPAMTSEDFSFMLAEAPGAYVFIGTGSEDRVAPLHSPLFDFDDDALPVGAGLLIGLAEASLAAR